MAEELNVGRIVAEIVLEAETQKAEEQLKNSMKTMQSNIQNIANHSVETVANAENRTFTAQQKSILKFYEQNKKLYQENQQELVKAINNIAERINMPKQALDDLKEYLGLSKQITEIPTVTVKETSTENMFENIRRQLENLGLEATDVNKIIESCFGDLTGYKKYQQQLDILSAKLEIQRQKVEDVKQAKDNAVNGTSAVSQEKAVKAYETENIKLKQLEAQYYRLSTSQEEYVNKKVASYQKEVTVAEATAEREIAAQQRLQDKQNEITVKETSANSMYESIRVQLESLGLEATNVNKIMESCFSDLTGYKKYQQQLDILSAKLEIQRQKVEEVKQAKDNAVNGTSAVLQEKAVKAYETENLKLKQLEIQYQNTKISQENYVNQKVSQYQRVVAVSDVTTAREIANQQKIQNRMSRNDTALIFADLTTSLRTFNTISPGAINNIGTIIRQINLLRRASMSSASTTMILATSAIAIVGTITTMAVNYYNSVKEKQEEARKKAVELTDNYKENIDTLKSATDSYIELTSKIRSNTLSETELYDNKKSLLEIQEKLVEAYGNEAKSIDLINGKFDEQIEKIDKLSQKEALLYTGKNSDKYKEAKEKLEKEYTFTVIDTNNIDTTTEEYKKLKQLLETTYETVDTVRGVGFKSEYQYAEDTLADIKDYIFNIQGVSEELKESVIATIDKSISNFPTDEINDYKNVVETYEKAVKQAEGSAKSLADNFEILQQTYENISKNISSVETLVSAYEKLSSGEQLDNSKLIELLDTYPKLVEYIAKTGDLSLESGEKIKEAQAEILQSSISALNHERTLLTFKKNKTAEENQLLQKIIATTDIYQNQLKELNSVSSETPKLNLSDFKTAVNDFGNAYKTLADGKQLDLNTTLDLIEKYPEFAKMLNNGSNSVDGQCQAVEKLFEAKKKEMLISLQADEQELQSLVTTTKAKISEYDKLIEKYNFIGSAVMEYKRNQTELKGNLNEYSDSLNQVKSQISAINDLNIESYKNTEKSASAINERLQEQLKLIEHRRALNNLSYAEEIS